MQQSILILTLTYCSYSDSSLVKKKKHFRSLFYDPGEHFIEYDETSFNADLRFS